MNGLIRRCFPARGWSVAGLVGLRPGEEAEMAVHFGDWLAGEIAKLGISQAEFARRAGIPLPTLRTWLKTAKSEIRGGNLQKLSRGLDRDAGDIRTVLRQAYYEAGDGSIQVPIRSRHGERLV